MPEQKTATGAGRVLVAVYGLFALAATSRAGVQIATKFHEAPVAYLLSALAAVVYIVATVPLARSDRLLALLCCGFELLGVLVAGPLRLVDGAAFPKATA